MSARSAVFSYGKTHRFETCLFEPFEHLRVQVIGGSIRYVDRECLAPQGASRLPEGADAHVLVLSEDGDAVRMAHPFSSAPMAFVLTPTNGSDDRRWWGGCAWHSFGISAALDLDVRIDTACPHCAKHLSFQAGPTIAPPQELAVRFPKPAADWWDDVVGTCTMIRLFCTHEHAEHWPAKYAPSSGYIADAHVVWDLAQPWYEDRLDADFQPHTRDHNQQLLAERGLVGEFWRLP